MLKLARRARGHFVMLIEIRVHLIRFKPGHISLLELKAYVIQNLCCSQQSYYSFPDTKGCSFQPILSNRQSTPKILHKIHIVKIVGIMDDLSSWFDHKMFYKTVSTIDNSYSICSCISFSISQFLKFKTNFKLSIIPIEK